MAIMLLKLVLALFYIVLALEHSSLMDTVVSGGVIGNKIAKLQELSRWNFSLPPSNFGSDSIKFQFVSVGYLKAINKPLESRSYVSALYVVKIEFVVHSLPLSKGLLVIG